MKIKKYFFILIFSLSFLAVSVEVFGAVQNVYPVKGIPISYKGKRYVLSPQTPLKALKCSADKCLVQFTLNGKTLQSDQFKRLSLKLAPKSSGPTTRAVRNETQKAETHTHSHKNNKVSFASPTCGCVYGSCRISSSFDPNRKHPRTGKIRPHRGDDIAGGAGTPIVAAESGTIETAGWRSGYGKTIKINHGSGYKTLYAHMSRYEKTSGYVIQGEVIGYMGSTGDVTGPHLHFEVFKDGVQIDPQQFLGNNRDTFSKSCKTIRAAGVAEAKREGAVLE